MKKVIQTIALFSTTFFFISCGGGGSSSGGDNGGEEVVNDAPSKVSLVYPTQNLLCIDNSIPFDWSDATDPNNDNVSYKLVVAKNRELTNVVTTRTVNSSEIRITLDKGESHYWSITAIDSKGLEGDQSSVFAFYTKGTGESNNVPFTAALVSPSNEGSVTGTTVNLKWTGADSDSSDTLTYDVYFGEDADPELSQSDITVSNFDVSVEAGKTYYWKINTKDDSNAKSIGQVWSFTVN